MKSAKGFLFLAALLIVFVTLLYNVSSKKGSVWKTLFGIFRLAESTSQYRSRQRTGA